LRKVAQRLLILQKEERQNISHVHYSNSHVDLEFMLLFIIHLLFISYLYTDWSQIWGFTDNAIFAVKFDLSNQVFNLVCGINVLLQMVPLGGVQKRQADRQDNVHGIGHDIRSDIRHVF
jgi:hypothetical protein